MKRGMSGITLALFQEYRLLPRVQGDVKVRPQSEGARPRDQVRDTTIGIHEILECRWMCRHDRYVTKSKSMA